MLIEFGTRQRTISVIYSWAPSLDVELFFEDRTYTLGDTIHVRVALNAKRDVTVRHGRVDLVYEVRWVAPETVHRPMGRLSRPGPGGQIMNSYALRFPTKKMVEHKHSYILGSTGFLERTHLEAHTDGGYNVQITIHKDDPPYAFIKGAAITWSLVAMFDVAWAIDVKRSRGLKVAFTPTGA